jgi:peroxiredoxin
MKMTLMMTPTQNCHRRIVARFYHAGIWRPPRQLVGRAGTIIKPVVIIQRMSALNEPAPQFELPDLDGRLRRLRDFHGRLVVLNFWSAECPWSERADRHLMELLQPLGQEAALLGIASNANEPEDLLCTAASQRGLPFVLRDLTGSVARMYGAVTTPHAFVIDRAGVLRYRGGVDNVTFRQRTASRWYVSEAIEALVAGRLPEVQDAPPYGCAIVLNA